VSALARHLKDRRIIVAARKGALRVSPHFYNDESDLETLREELTASVTEPRPSGSGTTAGCFTPPE
jgi:selenocysteine lyase/cysteine desulfurase